MFWHSKGKSDMLPQIHSMDISPATTASIITSMVISIIVPVGLCLYFWRKEGIHLRTVFIGAGVWLVVTQLLEKTVHLFVIQNTQILTQPFLFALYGALVAGIFEEGGRYIVFRQWLKDKRSWKDALAYGIGHGGMESILLGLLSGIPLLIFANLFSGGGISKLEGTIPPEAIEALKTALYGPSALFLLGGIRTAAGHLYSDRSLLCCLIWNCQREDTHACFCCAAACTDRLTGSIVSDGENKSAFRLYYCYSSSPSFIGTNPHDTESISQT